MCGFVESHAFRFTNFLTRMYLHALLFSHFFTTILNLSHLRNFNDCRKKKIVFLFYSCSAFFFSCREHWTKAIWDLENQIYHRRWSWWGSSCPAHPDIMFEFFFLCLSCRITCCHLVNCLTFLGIFKSWVRKSMKSLFMIIGHVRGICWNVQLIYEIFILWFGLSVSNCNLPFCWNVALYLAFILS